MLRVNVADPLKIEIGIIFLGFEFSKIIHALLTPFDVSLFENTWLLEKINSFDW